MPPQTTPQPARPPSRKRKSSPVTTTQSTAITNTAKPEPSKSKPSTNKSCKTTERDGVLRWTGSEIEVHLVPQVNYPPKLRKIIERHLVDLNASGLTLPDGSGRPLHLRLTRKEQIRVSIDATTTI